MGSNRIINTVNTLNKVRLVSSVQDDIEKIINLGNNKGVVYKKNPILGFSSIGFSMWRIYEEKWGSMCTIDNLQSIPLK